MKKVVIAAAGKGTRMRELTKDKPKHLIEVNGKPFLYYLLENIKKAGFKDIIVVGGYHIEKMHKFLKHYDSRINLVDQYKCMTNGRYGTACPVLTIKEIVGQEGFIFLSGDNLFSPSDLSNMWKLNNEFCYVSGVRHSDPNNFGVLKTKGEMLEKIIEKPRQDYGNLINASLYKFTRAIFDKIELIQVSQRGEYEITDAINLLAQEGKVKFVELKDYWYDFGRPEEIKKLETFLLK